jgi:hypothetical protein
MTKINESNLKRYQALLGYQINEGRGASSDSYYSSGKRILIKEADETNVDADQGYIKKGDGPQGPAENENAGGEAGQAPQPTR